MNKIILLTILNFFSLFFLNAQRECGTDLNHQLMMRYDTAYYNRFNNYQHACNLTETIRPKLDNIVYHIPVVVHVFHSGEPVGEGCNISDSMILNAINGLNQRWRNENGMGADLGIDFCLASVDPIGNPTSGILRIDASSVPLYASGGVKMLNYSACDGIAVDDTIIKNISTWPVLDYYNIWVVNDICGNVAGYAYFPWGGKFDGALMMYSYMNGSLNTLSHELGHGFNLQHTFRGDGGNVNCPVDTSCATDGDMVCDTPPHKSIDCGEVNPCTNEGVWDNSRFNYMSGCSTRNRFTEGQKNRVRSAAEIYPRVSLLTSSNSNCPNTSLLELNKEKERVVIHPNPLMFESTITTDVRGAFYLYDVFGRLVVMIEISNESTKIRRGNIPAGMYFYKFSNISGRIVIY